MKKNLIIVGEPQKQSASVRPQPNKPAISFDAWFMQAQRKHGLGDRMKKPLKLHMKATGFLASRDYEGGLKHFGWKAK